jgi:hypothetical protein
MNTDSRHSSSTVVCSRKYACVSLMIVLIMFTLSGCSSDSGGPATDPLRSVTIAYELSIP